MFLPSSHVVLKSRGPGEGRDRTEQIHTATNNVPSLCSRHHSGSGCTFCSSLLLFPSTCRVSVVHHSCGTASVPTSSRSRCKFFFCIKLKSISSMAGCRWWRRECPSQPLPVTSCLCDTVFHHQRAPPPLQDSLQVS